ncbi:S1 RNA-binding domain-containing protein [Candidatus Poribacteria bacterium]|nr:S1 RNA-binding domain-containing protein [Candidatus Poribacteria bacterium]
MDNVKDKIVKQIADDLSVKKKQVASTIKLLQDDNTVPFIARYRKEVTGSLDEVKIYDIQKQLDYYSELEERKETILKTIETQDKLTDELRETIENCMNKKELEDIYLPYKPKRRTKASVAIESGLEPFAQQMLLFQNVTSGSVDEYAVKYVDPEKNVNTVEEACLGAEHIICSWVSENAEIRKMVRRISYRMGNIVTKVKDEYKDKRSKYEMYYDHIEPVKDIPPHRVLAINRAERENFISVSIQTLDDHILELIRRHYIQNQDSIFQPHIESAIDDAFKNYIFPSIENEIRNELTESADQSSISVFSENLRELLLQPPAADKVIMGIDPGLRTGSKVTVIDKTGKYLGHAVIYPLKPQNKVEESDKILKSLIENFGVDIIAIGNGTGSRELSTYIREMLERIDKKIQCVTVNESGASVYSASEIAREELPDMDVSIRGAVSIARRWQDPLAELVKIDPKSIGVGQYQHDVNQGVLSQALDNTVESVVNYVGVDLNTASYSLLKYVAGIGPSLARNIVEYRNEKGGFQDLKNLMEVPRLGDKAFQQAAGFLRIRNGINPLDNSAVHPESYEFVKTICNNKSVSVNDLIGNQELISTLVPKDLISDNIGLPTIRDIIDELKKPGRDPRMDYVDVAFSPDIIEMEDLSEGMILNGVVTNVTHFGAFVDVGVHQDGLVHVSEMANRYIKDPTKFCKVGDRIKIKVISIDMDRKRIGLSMKQVGKS